MKNSIKSIRPFIGAENFEISRNFYSDLGFEEIVLEKNLSLFKKQETAFYLQDATLKELKFTEGYLVKHRENFDSTGDNPLTETFTISARMISMGSGEFRNEWPEIN